MDSGAAGRIHEKMNSFKRKYYMDIFVRGLILSFSILVVYFLVVSILEYNFWLGGWARFLTFLSFFLVAAYCIIRFLREPLQWWIANRGLSEEESARLIGSYIPSVRDRLLNFVQLESSSGNALAQASIFQRTREFEPLSFDSVIDIKQNKRYLKYLIIPLAVVGAILVINGGIITQSAERIIFFNREYSPKAPFSFELENKNLAAFYNEDFNLSFQIKGASIPNAAYLITNKLRLKLQANANGSFSYTFEKLQTPFSFQIEAAGFYSDAYSVEVFNRPELSQFRIELEYPRYLQRKNEQLINVGNLEVPEGTEVTWRIKTSNTETVNLYFSTDSIEHVSEPSDNQTFKFKKAFAKPAWYEIILQNNKSKNKDRINYTVDVIKDQHPTIVVNNLKDSVLFKRILLGGAVSDDYGISALALHYIIRNADGKEVGKQSVSIPVNRNQTQQNFFFNWAVDSLKLKAGEQLEYYLQVWDNDGVNGRKSTTSARYSLHVPTGENLMVEIKKSQSRTEEKIDQSHGKARKLQDQIEQASQKLKGKQSLNWQDKKMLDDIIQQKDALNKMLDELKQQNKLLDQKKDAFTEQDERIREKAQQIQKLMDELLDEETKKLFQELQKLLEENAQISDIQKLLNKLNQNTDNLEKELERTLELFKQLQYEFKFDQAVKSLEQQIERQESLLNKTEQLEKEQALDKKNKNDSNDKSAEESKELAKEQEQLMRDVQQNKENLQELEKLGEQLHNEAEVPEQEELEEILKEQEQSRELLENNQPTKSKSPQQKALQEMKEMKQQMQSAMSGMSMEIDMENLESLRQIIHGLVKLSFDQEAIMKQFSDLNPNDPRFNSIAQRQLKLRDDTRVIEDSLLALGKRDPFLGPVVTKEVGELKEHLDKAIEANKERKRPQASSEMQATMTSINNLALMLDDHFQMMMEMMANAKASKGKGKNNKKGQKPNLGQMQQELNQKIQELKNSGKTGKQLSEELAELAAEQERIRKALQKMQEDMKQNGDSPIPGDQIPGKMEQTEMDLVNKQLTDQVIRRQQDILTRLLEAEKSMREQDMDEERKGETAKDYDKEIPKAFEEYLRLKEKEVELLKTVPPKLYPYYKKEVTEYFKRMGN
jgi:hypothetical protein